MGVTTVAAARIFDGQSKGMLGEENMLEQNAIIHIITYAFGWDANNMN